MPVRYASPAPPNREPDPIQVQTSVPTSSATGTDRPATMKSSWLFTPRARQTLTAIRKAGYSRTIATNRLIGILGLWGGATIARRAVRR
jgi:hypothetical protein